MSRNGLYALVAVLIVAAGVLGYELFAQHQKSGSGRDRRRERRAEDSEKLDRRAVTKVREFPRKDELRRAVVDLEKGRR